jgi:peptide/nickel transport system permease protein
VSARPWLRTVLVLVGAGALALVALLVPAPAGAPLEAPSLAHPLGTDATGHDVARTLGGALVVLGGLVLPITTLFALVGTWAGFAAGLRGGFFDERLIRGLDLVDAIPPVFGAAFAEIALHGSSVGVLALVVGACRGAESARLSRAIALRGAGGPIAEAARAVGRSPVELAGRHTWRAARRQIVASGLAASFDLLLVESALSLFGFGAPIGVGRLVAEGLAHRAPWLAGSALATTLAVGALALATARADVSLETLLRSSRPADAA